MIFHQNLTPGSCEGREGAAEARGLGARPRAASAAKGSAESQQQTQEPKDRGARNKHNPYPKQRPALPSAQQQSQGAAGWVTTP